MTKRPALTLLMRGYLNQDWPEEFSDVWEGVNAFVRGESHLVNELRDEVRNLVEQHPSEQKLQALFIDELDGGYWPPGGGTTFTKWLAALDRHCWRTTAALIDPFTRETSLVRAQARNHRAHITRSAGLTTPG